MAICTQYRAMIKVSSISLLSEELQHKLGRQLTTDFRSD
jgi:hypothetical protein